MYQCHAIFVDGAVSERNCTNKHMYISYKTIQQRDTNDLCHNIHFCSLCMACVFDIFFRLIVSECKCSE